MKKAHIIFTNFEILYQRLFESTMVQIIYRIFCLSYGFEVGTTSGMAWFNPDGCTHNDLIFHILYSFVSVPMFGAWCGSMGAAIFEEIKEFEDI